MIIAGNTTTSQRAVQDSYQRLKVYLANRPLECFDRADFKGLPAIVKLQQARLTGSIGATLALKSLYLKAWLAPFLTRRLLGVKPGLTASGLAFYASALIDCYKLEGDDQLLNRVNEILDKLKSLNVGTANEPAWGFPFDWVSFELVPANTPIGYSTYTAADAFFSHHALTGNSESLAWATGACDFLSHNLATTPVGDGLALAYTPLDHSQVLNYNALSAALMLEIDAQSSTHKYQELAHSMLKFVLHKQQPDGSWFYAEDGSRIDHYHTAMTLQGLARCVPILEGMEQQQRVVRAINLGLGFHLQNMWEADEPRNSNWSRYPLDPLSPAESIIAFSYIADLKIIEDDSSIDLTQQRWIQTMIWTINKMQGRDGSFATLHFPIRPLRLRSLRWGDAPLLRALALTLIWLRREEVIGL